MGEERAMIAIGRATVNGERAGIDGYQVMLSVYQATAALAESPALCPPGGLYAVRVFGGGHETLLPRGGPSHVAYTRALCAQPGIVVT